MRRNGEMSMKQIKEIKQYHVWCFEQSHEAFANLKRLHLKRIKTFLNHRCSRLTAVRHRYVRVIQ